MGRALETQEVNLDQVIALTLEQAKQRYSMGANSISKIADMCEGNIRFGKVRRFHREKIDKFLLDELSV
ncbi:DUF6462 family protein [Parasporobacterium paucivorans]|uniref:DNA binding domain-containing protein, excisionase family n=1 Tax=Parasporobacterium paucivorans DSM 15970 TaxID=1122934 RepID=A0A1M6F465_9FIRM|nr:DUF6462 family protein [Parasporobacterium paucivorans]SHI92508.1 hypothetical protein SAMN02745691_01046 [Parasporobacterium paucivorans DSM 15970]